MHKPESVAPLVSFAGVRFAYGSRVILDDLNLDIAPGESVALVGRSGAGKSTLLKLINRLLVPDAGSVRVQGRDTREWDPIALRRRTGYVLQDIGLFPHLTVEENVALVPRLEGWPDDKRRARAHELLDLVGLAPAEFATRWPRELSGGQRQRVSVARALAIDPPLVLMDEPFGALDAMTRQELRAEFQRIRRHLRQTVVFVTHDNDEAFALGDRVGVLENGRTAASSPRWSSGISSWSSGPRSSPWRSVFPPASSPPIARAWDVRSWRPRASRRRSRAWRCLGSCCRSPSSAASARASRSSP
ncbi:MAG: ABC transporter ATP-binding protein [Acidobacteria bacterium]|nr:MAG: ABC transporter ATP-binding protein [Acidobacteriota bacterium]